MNIYDCFTFFDENEILEIRLNELDKYVDYFVIVEAGQNHRGIKKNKNINEDIINKFKSKVRYCWLICKSTLLEIIILSKEKGVKLPTSVVDSISIGAVFFTPIFFFAPQPINANIKKK